MPPSFLTCWDMVVSDWRVAKLTEDVRDWAMYVDSLWLLRILYPHQFIDSPDMLAHGIA